MAEVVVADFVEFDHNFGSATLNRLVRVPPHLEGMNRARDIRIILVTINDIDSPIGQIMKVSIKEEGNLPYGPYGVTLKVTCDGNCDSVTIRNGRIPLNVEPAFETIFFKGREVFLNTNTKVRLTFHPWTASGKTMGQNICEAEPNSIFDDLKQFAEAGKQISLICSDGEVTVSGRLLKARSPALMAMLTHDTKEKKESKISLEDYDTTVIQGLNYFLATDEVVFNKDTVLDLYILGDMYHVQGLKSAARKLILSHIKDLDPKQVFNAVSKIDTDLIEKVFIQKYS